MIATVIGLSAAAGGYLAGRARLAVRRNGRNSTSAGRPPQDPAKTTATALEK
jgi:hypothetical protein